MSDYRITVRVRNGRLLRALESIGHNPSSFAREYGCCVTELCAIARMEQSPLDSKGFYRKSILKVMEVTRFGFDELFTERQIEGFEKTITHTELTEDQAASLGVAPRETNQLKALEDRDFAESLLDHLTPRTRLVCSLRAEGLTLEEVGEVYDATRERIRQIEAKGHRVMRHHAMKSHLKNGGNHE